MKDQSLMHVVEKHPIGDGLKAFRDSFTPNAIERLGQEELQNCILILLSALQIHPAARLLRSNNGSSVFSEISSLNTLITSDDYDLDLMTPLIKNCLAESVNDTIIWDQVCRIVAGSTPPPRPIPPSLQQTPWSQNRSSFVNSSERRQEVDRILKHELRHLYVDVPGFYDAFFGSVRGLNTASETVLRKCMEGDNPLFREGWIGWPTRAKEPDVLAWFCDLIPRLEALAGDFNQNVIYRRKLLAQAKTPLLGSTGKRSMDIGFVAHDFAYKPNSKDDRFRWQEVLVPGELKSNPAADITSLAWINLATYAREVLKAQDALRFVLGFTLCGSIMRVWQFDRLGGIASDKFDINSEDGALQFVTAILGFLCMDEENLGFDPTIITSHGERYITINRDGQTERIYIHKVIKRAPCIAGRATTCWKAYRREDPQVPLVIKDSWQYINREEEGEYLREATNKGVVNVARYYHHETVYIRGVSDDIRNHVRKGLDLSKAKIANFQRGRRGLPPSVSVSSVSREGKSNSSGLKRPSSETDTRLPAAKRSCSESLTKASIDPISNRVHRRIVLLDYGEPIYQASSRVALLSAFESCIEGHESLHKAGFLHRDISINNLMINEDKKSSSWAAFLIDLDLAIKRRRESASGAKGKTGTRAFMAIGALLGEEHSFMHDLESFFWVLFWICIHYDAQGKSIGPTRLDDWNTDNDDKLVASKKGEIADEEDFLKNAEKNFTSHYQPLIPWVNRMRRHVFPNGGRWKKCEPELYSTMKKILQDAQRDQDVLAEE
ncbi:serine/threonine-protein kinase Sgk2 [Metarhizium rileyi]|uniref:non-specific serine/threonine protein kinase n=1 Tax=Metarhizium rileyi (strain RCEF 4871) TaxID=1649241 RepID=A0A162JBU4_METRR|nr:serine/threonine-protein kinase Sgk2 [Metarhizium rileyi RCEF 4871]